jgi:hypothetical protein
VSTKPLFNLASGLATFSPRLGQIPLREKRPHNLQKLDRKYS